MIHPKNIKPGKFLIATAVRGEIREPVLDYTEAAQIQHLHAKFREIAGIPLEVLAVHDPFMMVRHRRPEPSSYYSYSRHEIDHPVEAALNIYAFDFAQVKGRYARAMPATRPRHLDLLDAYRIVDAHQEQMRRERAAQVAADQEALRRRAARRR